MSGSQKKIIIGLGNKGSEYKDTRHNVGFMTVDRLAQEFGVKFKKKNALCEVASTVLDGQKVILAKPLTYMNLSGQAVSFLLNEEQVKNTDFLIVCDDVDLSLGSLRMKNKGSAGGHNGLKSIIQEILTQDFLRLRIGIGGRENGCLTDHVLGAFKKHEKEVLDKVLDYAAKAVLDFLNCHDIQKMMSVYNKQLVN